MKKSIRSFFQEMISFPVSLAVIFFTIIIFITGCKKESAQEIRQAGDVVSKSSNSHAADIIVEAGQSIQAAVNAAVPGTVIRVQPGTYQEAIVVNTPNISIIGNGNVIIENPGDEENGITVRNAGGWLCT